LEVNQRRLKKLYKKDTTVSQQATWKHFYKTQVNCTVTEKDVDDLYLQDVSLSLGAVSVSYRCHNVHLLLPCLCQVKEITMKLIKSIITTITFAFAAQQLVAGGHGDGHPILTPLEPKAMEGAYTAMLMGEDTFKANSSFDEKTYQLVALAASAGMKCEYCIIAHTALAKAAGASDEEIKTVAMMTGIIAINSTMLYANQFDLENLRKMFGQ